MNIQNGKVCDTFGTGEMMEIEDAINSLHNIDVSKDMPDDYTMDEMMAFHRGVDTLRLEQTKHLLYCLWFAKGGCDFCDNPTMKEIEIKKDGELPFKQQINYCPICGRHMDIAQDEREDFLCQE